MKLDTNHSDPYSVFLGRYGEVILPADSRTALDNLLAQNASFFAVLQIQCEKAAPFDLYVYRNVVLVAIR